MARGRPLDFIYPPLTMELTYILVDFENVQPQDLNLLRGEQYRVKVFHGPHQNKLDMVIVKALQPLGEHVEYIQREKAGKNALDFHMAFCIGRLVQEHKEEQSSTHDGARFIVISKDGGFESLLCHVRSLGFAAGQAATIGDALAVVATTALFTPVAPPVRPAKPAPTAAAIVEPQNAAPKAKIAKKAKATSSEKLGPDDLKKVAENLRTHTKNRPVKRDALERHVTTVLGGKVTQDSVRELVAELERGGLIEIGEKQIKYKLPKEKK
jgi:PIN domain-containing protein